MRNISAKICTENENTHFMSNDFFFRKSCSLWDNVEKCGAREATDENTTRHMLYACWVRLHAHTHTYTNTPSRHSTHTSTHARIPARAHTPQKYVIYIAFPRKQRLPERASMLRYVCALSLFSGALARLRKAIIIFVMLVCPSVCPHGTTRPH